MGLPAVFALDGVERDYAWGSTTALQRLLGREPDGRPLAELWFGAHPAAPSPVPALGATLDELIAAEPAAVLGGPVAGRFGGRLPFLVKLLAAERPLSVQVHPTRAQAEAGFAAEQARGIPAGAPQRNYRDANHKPELLWALTEFEALCGFRPVADTLRLLDAFDLPELQPVRELLTGPDPLRAALTYLLRLPEPGPLVTAVSARAGAVGGTEWSGAADAVLRAADAFPGDIGVVLSLLLNAVVLQPGEAIYLGAGNVHAYLHGFGVEIMANSDNVLRCGLTSKHVDVTELLEITDFTELADPRWPVAQVGLARWRCDVPVHDFALERIDLDEGGSGVDSTSELPRIALCVSGEVGVHSLSGDSVRLRPGGAAFIAGTRFTSTLRGAGQVFLATVNDRLEI